MDSIRECIRYIYFSGNDEGNGLDRGTVNFVCTGNFAIRNAQCAAGQETHPTLRVSGFVL